MAAAASPLLAGTYVDARDLVPTSALGELARAYLQDQQDRGRGERTLAKYDAMLREFLGFAGDIRVKDLDLRVLKAYSTHLGRRRNRRPGHERDAVAPTTKNLHLITLRGMLRYGSLLDLPVPAPDKVQLAKAPSADPDARHLRRDRLERLLDAPDLAAPNGPRDRALLEVLLATGCRISEVIALDRSRVELDARAPDLGDGIRVSDEITVLGKGRRHRKVFLSQRAREWLAKYLRARRDRDPALFVTRRRDASGSLRMSVRTAAQIIETQAKRAGLSERVSPHWLRHAAVTHWAKEMGLTAAQHLAGHRDVATTSRYLGASDAELKALYKARIG